MSPAIPPLEGLLRKWVGPEVDLEQDVVRQRIIQVKVTSLFHKENRRKSFRIIQVIIKMILKSSDL